MRRFQRPFGNLSVIIFKKKWDFVPFYTFEELKWHAFSEANAFYSFKVAVIYRFVWGTSCRFKSSMV